jgi:hypothetical protein
MVGMIMVKMRVVIVGLRGAAGLAGTAGAVFSPLLGLTVSIDLRTVAAIVGWSVRFHGSGLVVRRGIAGAIQAAVRGAHPTGGFEPLLELLTRAMQPHGEIVARDGQLDRHLFG